MDLGCFDLGCVSVSEKQSNEAYVDSESKETEASESVATASEVGKNKALKETGQPTANALNKFTLQIKKPFHRKNSPINWFPRKKADSYLKRKIKMLQELGGMNSTLDETLGDSNPHYTRVEKEKIAAREAARKAMEARKAAMIEASWCRILQAARIQSKEAETLLLNAEKSVSEAFEAAMAMGVIMYDILNFSMKPCEIETSSIHGGGSTTTHTVAATFETAFEVDKDVAAAVKTAFIRLANCPSINKDEFRDLLRKISQNPDTGEDNQELSYFSSECELDTGPKLELGFQKDDFCDLDCKMSVAETEQRKCKKRKLSDNFSKEKLIDMMLERLKCLQEEELASLATIVATCGLSAALAEAENGKQQLGSAADFSSDLTPNFIRRMSSLGPRTLKMSNLELNGQMTRKQAEFALPSLDKILVRRMSKLEREVLEAKNTRMNEPKKASGEKLDKSDVETVELDNNITSSETMPDLGSILVKHTSKLEKDIEEAKRNSGKKSQIDHKDSVCVRTSSENVPDLESILIKHSSKLEKEIEDTRSKYGETLELNDRKSERLRNGVVSCRKNNVVDVPSLDKFLVKHVSRLEREVQEAKNRRRNDSVEGTKVGKENVNLIQINQVNNEVGETFSQEDEKDGIDEKENIMDKILVKPMHRLEREKMQALSPMRDNGIQRNKKKLGGNSITDCESLDKVLVRHVSRLEREKMTCKEVEILKKSNAKIQSEKNERGLDQILVKHKSRLEQEKIAAAQQSGEQINSLAGQEARKRELQEAWGGLSLENSAQSEKNEGGLDRIFVKHKLRLEQEKIAATLQSGERIKSGKQIKYSLARKEARERELQEAWGGLSLGNSIRPHLSKLERDKATWIKAEEEQKRVAKGASFDPYG
ncbi:uncharacterized protein LOC131156510 [Malania oleifera]|uniref:uncharacterized protein LOC131156510 n=1 Tax=Malania oleifera TaxID=397392 RepID=UPI0025ADF364|nr:uncharacterized protein LOC131156510 [Malania oleifera]